MSNEILSTSVVKPQLVVGAVAEAHDTLVILPRIRTTVLDASQGITGSYAIMPTLSVADITEGTGMSNTSYAQTAKNITAAQRGIKVTALDIALRASPFGWDGIQNNVIRQVTQDIDGQVAAKFAGFTTNAQVTGNTLTSALVFQALGRVLSGTGNMAMGSPDITLAIHTTQAASLMSDLASNGAALAQTSIMQGVANGNLGSLYGVQVVTTNQIPDAGTGKKSGGLFFRDALGAVVQWAVRPVTLAHPDAGGGPGVIATVTHSSGYAELVDEYGVQVVTN